MSEERVPYPMPQGHEWREHGEQPPADAEAIPEVIELGEPEQVQARIRARYGFEPSVTYCRDLLAFVEELSREMVL